MKERSEVEKYQIIFPPGASGHFLKNFLNIDYPDIETSSWASDETRIKCSYISCNHHKNSNSKRKTIGIVPADINDLIKISTNRFLKSNRIYRTIEFNITSNKFLDKIYTSVAESLIKLDFNYSIDIFSTDFDICVFYTQIFKIDELINLYYKINNISIDKSKLTFAKKYIDYHQHFYQTPYYTALHKILEFEYKNQLFEKTKTWSIDLINLTDINACNENLKNFLKKENYL